MKFRSTLHNIKRLLKIDTNTRIARVGRYLFVAGILGLLAYQLTGIGWGEIWRSLPVTPWFYFIFLLIYLALPFSETLIYRASWKFPFLSGFAALVKKRVYNKDVLGYSGEFFLYFWARKHLALGEREIFGTVKDNAIVSSVASTTFAVLVLSILFLSGQIALDGILSGNRAIYVIVALVVGVVLCALGIRFRRTFFRLPGRVLAFVFAVHMVRLVVVSLLQVVQWMVVLPDISIRVWFTFLAVQIVTSRIPLLPSRDLIFIGASVELSRILDVSSAGIAGMMLVSSVLDKVLNFSLFSILSFIDRKRGQQPELLSSTVESPAESEQISLEPTL